MKFTTNTFSFDKIMITIYQSSGYIYFSYPSKSFKFSVFGFLCLIFKIVYTFCGFYFSMDIDQTFYESSSKVLIVATYISAVVYFTFITSSPIIMLLKRRKIFKLFMILHQHGDQFSIFEKIMISFTWILKIAVWFNSQTFRDNMLISFYRLSEAIAFYTLLEIYIYIVFGFLTHIKALKAQLQ